MGNVTRTKSGKPNPVVAAYSRAWLGYVHLSRLTSFASFVCGDGTAALAQEDTNLDGKVDAADARFASLRIWRDVNQDGISQAGELTTLAANNVAALNVAKTENTTLLANGCGRVAAQQRGSHRRTPCGCNVIADLGTYVKADGTTGTLGDVELAENTFRSRFADSVALTEQAQSLPDMRGSSQVRATNDGMRRLAA